MNFHGSEKERWENFINVSSNAISDPASGRLISDFGWAILAGAALGIFILIVMVAL